MSRRVFLPLLLALLLAAGCSGGEERDAAAGGGMSASQTESSPRPLTDEEILAAYARAEEAWGWFVLSPLPDTGDTVTLDGMHYRRVSAAGLGKVEDLRTYLRSLFTADLTEELLSAGGAQPLYRDIDGALYVRAVGRSRAAGKGEAEAEVTRVDETAYTVDVTVPLLDSDGVTAAGLECWSFPYALVDSRWVFTDFHSVY